MYSYIFFQFFVFICTYMFQNWHHIVCIILHHLKCNIVSLSKTLSSCILWTIFVVSIFSFLKNNILFIFRQRRREGKREGEKHQCLVASVCPTLGNLALNPGMCPDWELNRWTFGSQAGTQSTEPHQPGPVFIFSNWKCASVNILMHSSLNTFWLVP